MNNRLRSTAFGFVHFVQPTRPDHRGWRYRSLHLTDALRDRLKELATLYAQ